MAPLIVVAALVLGVEAGAEPLPLVRVERVPLRVEKSCRVAIAPWAVFAPEKGAEDGGVIRVEADGVTVEFAEGSVLRGAPADLAQDLLVGTGIVVEGHEGVTLRNIALSGFKVGVRAVSAKGLVIDGARIEGMYAQRLRSTPAAEDSGDWLWPHRNDGDEWTRNYGAAVSVKDSSGVTIHDVRVRRGQNGILLSRVDESRVFDNDCSFLSGWGLGMWRSSKNTVSRNAFDFCIRGYSHGVYNRGQDSAGILMFEQCCENVIVENSVTHGGDGFFGFAGREALGETWAEGHKVEVVPEAEVARHKGLGCNGNLLLDNDLSYAAAHGIEMTFSFGNRFMGNRLEENGICGVWGGYSAQTVISGNRFARNGGAGGRGEGGGINIEHGRENRISGNTFTEDSTGIRLWGKPGSGLEKLLWGLANGEKVDGVMRVPSTRNLIRGNSFSGVKKEFWIFDTVRTEACENRLGGGDVEVELGSFGEAGLGELPESPARGAAPGARRPVGARMELEGRDQIVMGEFGPWDHETVMVRAGKRSGSGDLYEVLGAGVEPVSAKVLEGEVRLEWNQQMGGGGHGAMPVPVRVLGLKPGVWPYRVRISAGTFEREVAGTIVDAKWEVTVFAWEQDPQKDVGAWRVEAQKARAVRVETAGIDWALGYTGPGCIAPEVAAAKIGANHYGVLARTRVRLPAGRWVVKTLSDDGVRVSADGKKIIERWDVHGPMEDRVVVVVVEKEREVEIGVEYFQNDGYAVLKVGIERAE